MNSIQKTQAAEKALEYPEKWMRREDLAGFDYDWIPDSLAQKARRFRAEPRYQKNPTAKEAYQLSGRNRVNTQNIGKIEGKQPSNPYLTPQDMFPLRAGEGRRYAAGVMPIMNDRDYLVSGQQYRNYISYAESWGNPVFPSVN